MDNAKYGKVVVKVGFINENGDLETESARVLEWDNAMMTPKEFMSSVEEMAMKYGADIITTPGTSSN